MSKTISKRFLEKKHNAKKNSSSQKIKKNKIGAN